LDSTAEPHYYELMGVEISDNLYFLVSHFKQLCIVSLFWPSLFIYFSVQKAAKNISLVLSN